MSTKKTNSKEIPNSSPSRAKAKRKAVVRRVPLSSKTPFGTLVPITAKELTRCYGKKVLAVAKELHAVALAEVRASEQRDDGVNNPFHEHDPRTQVALCAIARFITRLGITTGGART